VRLEGPKMGCRRRALNNPELGMKYPRLRRREPAKSEIVVELLGERQKTNNSIRMGRQVHPEEELAVAPCFRAFSIFGNKTSSLLGLTRPWPNGSSNTSRAVAEASWGSLGTKR